jgi:dTDP-4-amino-4,6-dideoxygalactose transaminase
MIPRRRQRTYRGIFLDILKFLLFSSKTDRNIVEVFEEELARYIEVKHVITTASGRFALQLLLEASGLPKGSKIVFPALTLNSLIQIVKKMGYNPIIVDVEKNTLNLNIEKLEEALSEHDCKAIIATHLFGNPCEIHKIEKLAEKYNVLIFEDCAHALGSRIEDIHVGNFGLGSIFSFETIKNLNTFGGGCIATNDDELNFQIRDWLKNLSPNYPAFFKKVLMAQILDIFLRSPFYDAAKRMMNHGTIKKLLTKRYLKFREANIPKPSLFNSGQAKLGLKMLKLIDHMNKRCEYIFNEYNKRLSHKIVFQSIKKGHISSYYIVVARIDIDPVLFCKMLSDRGIDIGFGHEIVDYIGNGNAEMSDVAYTLSKSIVQFPCFYQMNDKSVNKVIREVENVLEIDTAIVQ